MDRKHLNASHLLSSERLLQIFLDAGQLLIKKIDDNGKKVIFFEVKDYASISYIQIKLNKYIDNNGGADLSLVSNKKKPLYLVAEYIHLSMENRWSLSVYQKNALGDIVSIIPSTDSLAIDFFSVLKPIQVEFEYRQSFLVHINMHKKREKELLDDFYLLTESDLKILLTRSLFSKEIDMIRYTYVMYVTGFDHNINKIDDNTQMGNAEKKNNALSVIIKLCEENASKHKFSLVGEETK